MTSSPSRRDALALATVAALAGGAALLAGCGPNARARATVNAGTPVAVPSFFPPTVTAVPSPTTSPAPVGAAPPTLPSPDAGTGPETTLGGMSVGMRGAAVLRALSQPPVRTVTHGMGTPEWHYANGLTVRLTDPHNPARPDTVWEIAARQPFVGATATGFRLGDSAAQFRDLYRGLPITAPHVRQLRVVAPDGTSLDVRFDESGAATSIIFANNRLP